jgi:hypothetical protein
MRKRSTALKSILVLSILMIAAISCFAEDDTEITGYYQQYRNFSFKTGSAGYPEFSADALKGGGFMIARNIAPWFAMWTQLSFYGTLEQNSNSVRVINNLEGLRWQTKQHGPFRFYVKGGLGFSYYSLNFSGVGSTSGTKFSAAYGGGTDIWMNKHFGVKLDVSQVFMGLPNVFDVSGRESWDSGMTYTTGLTVRF